MSLAAVTTLLAIALQVANHPHPTRRAAIPCAQLPFAPLSALSFTLKFESVFPIKTWAKKR
jgi:hypothetical protein